MAQLKHPTRRDGELLCSAGRFEISDGVVEVPDSAVAKLVECGWSEVKSKAAAPKPKAEEKKVEARPARPVAKRTAVKKKVSKRRK